ncbi:MAG: hypothetical protein V4654_01630 [Bdellovibrionota bacterium]
MNPELIDLPEGKINETTLSCISLSGLRAQLESIVMSDFGDLLATDNTGIDLFDKYKFSKIIFLFLDLRRYGETHIL